MPVCAYVKLPSGVTWLVWFRRIDDRAVSRFAPDCAAAVATGSGAFGELTSLLSSHSLICSCNCYRTEGFEVIKFGTGDVDRLWLAIDKRTEDECWPWIAKSRHWKGYGIITIANGKPGGVKLVASRMMCFIAHGPEPFEKAKALHSCDNPPCCNPAHLRWGTQKENVEDAKERDRHVNPPRIHSNPEWNAKRLAAMPKGEALHNQSLSEEKTREIWRLHFEHKSASEIAKIVGSSAHVVYDVCRGRSWRHLPSAPSIEELKKGGVRRGFNQFSRTDTPP